MNMADIIPLVLASLAVTVFGTIAAMVRLVVRLNRRKHLQLELPEITHACTPIDSEVQVHSPHAPKHQKTHLRARRRFTGIHPPTGDSVHHPRSGRLISTATTRRRGAPPSKSRWGR